MKIQVGAATKGEIIRDAILAIKDPVFTYTGKNGMYMIFECDNPDNKDYVRLVKDTLKSNTELSMIYFNISLG